ncbi:DUF2130 domain-containing protein [bacterium]|nr:DUF2130 domain-containing protein [bacterium]
MTNSIKCPKCGEEINIENLIQAGTKAALDKEVAALQEKFEKELAIAKQNAEKLKEKSEEEKEKAIEAALNSQKMEFKQKEEKMKQTLLEEQKEAYEELEKELQEKSNQLKEMNKLKAEKSRIEREKEELAEKIAAEAEKEYGLKLIEEKQKMQKSAEEKFEMQIRELQKQLEDQKILTEEMKKRQEQGSMQLQGEVQELAIEEYLKETFKYDEILEVGKGDMGADSIQTVHTMHRQNCGTIYYESKRTKTFNNDWIAKFKNDIQTRGADIGVLVTAVYPKDMDRMGLRDGIYICTFEEFKALSVILRESIIKISETKAQQENRHEKSELLYNYLTSTEFRFQFETIVNAFVEMQKDLESEKRSMNKQWKKREKEILNVISATTDMYGSIQGLAGNAIKPVAQLEMPLLETVKE